MRVKVKDYEDAPQPIPDRTCIPIHFYLYRANESLKIGLDLHYIEKNWDNRIYTS